MPIITIMVPMEATDTQLCDLRMKVSIALEMEGTPRNASTVEFIPCRLPNRLVINYDSRSVRLIEEKGRLDRDARVVGKIVEEEMKLPVECVVRYCDPQFTGLYLTRAFF